MLGNTGEKNKQVKNCVRICDDILLYIYERGKVYFLR